MPSQNQHAATRSYEPSEYAEAFDEDPARFLCSNEMFAKARIRGIDDADLLTAYANVEGERHGRKAVLATINQRLDAIRSNT